MELRSGTLYLAWDKAAGASSYRLYQIVAGSMSLTLSGLTATQAAVNGVDTNATSQWAVTGVSAQGEGAPSKVFTYTPGQTPPPQPPAAPTGLSGQFLQSKRIDLEWHGDATASTEVERSVDGGAWTWQTTVAPGTMHWSDTAVWKKERNAYRVRSRNAAGASGYSNVITLPPW